MVTFLQGIPLSIVIWSLAGVVLSYPIVYALSYFLKSEKNYGSSMIIMIGINLILTLVLLFTPNITLKTVPTMYNLINPSICILSLILNLSLFMTVYKIQEVIRNKKLVNPCICICYILFLLTTITVIRDILFRFEVTTKFFLNKSILPIIFFTALGIVYLLSFVFAESTLYDKVKKYVK